MEIDESKIQKEDILEIR